MKASEIRRLFLDYFASEGHTVVESSSLIPHGDPTLLFTNSGMVQFKDVFTGSERRPYLRATTSQKCVRAGGKHNDLDQVGHTPRHHTFFEMLGNFSFGDYFKQEAIRLAWRFLTEQLKLDPQRLWITVYLDDDEAVTLWQQVAGVPAGRIVRLGDDNFWSMGDTGPCGPCSEIMYDRGAEYACEAEHCGIGACDCDRWLEIWNLVFMQYERDAQGTMTPLPRPSIDTGMGLERISSVMQGVQSNWQTDLFTPILTAIAELAGHPYHGDERGFAHRVVADHLRAGVFLVADGVLPGNLGRGYVLRRILRRAVRIGRGIELPAEFLSRLAPTVIRQMSDGYPALLERERFVVNVLRAEETRFLATLDEGGRLLDRLMAGTPAGGQLPGQAMFELYDTYGFPPDLTAEVAEAHGLSLDWTGYERALEEQRQRARAHREAYDAHPALTAAMQELEPTDFVGYQTTHAEGEVLALFVDGELRSIAKAPERVEVVLARSPFYGESGGQIGDVGMLQARQGAVRVLDVRRLPGGRLLHLGELTHGHVSVGEIVQAHVEGQRREAIARHHTATHLLHEALRHVLGSHVHQAGSVVSADRLRFDYTHPDGLTAEQREAVEDRMNAAILANAPVAWSEMPLAQARSLGAMALFEEKYGDIVRVVEIADWSRELCGGTHVLRTGDIGLCRIVSESGIGSGVRRIEAVAGRAALAAWRSADQRWQTVMDVLRVPDDAVEARLGQLQEDLRQMTARLQKARQRAMADAVLQIVAQAEDVGGVALAAGQIAIDAREELRLAVDRWRERVDAGVLVLAAACENRAELLVAVTPDLVVRGVHAGRILSAAVAAVGGRGGGRPDMAQGGGKDVTGLQAALAAARRAMLAELGFERSAEADG